MKNNEQPFEPTTDDVAAMEAQQKHFDQLLNPKPEHIDEAARLIVRALNIAGASTVLSILGHLFTGAHQTIGQSSLEMAKDVDPRDRQLTIVKSNLFAHASNAVAAASLMLENLAIVFAERPLEQESEIPHFDVPVADPSNN